MTNQARENELWKLYCDGLEPVMEIMVKHIALAALELGVHRATELLGKAFDLTFASVTERIWAEIEHIRAGGAPREKIQ